MQEPGVGGVEGRRPADQLERELIEFNDLD